MVWYRHLPPFFLGVLAGLFDVAVSPWFPGVWVGVRAALPLVALLAIFSRPQRAAVAALAAGMVLDAVQPTVGLVTFRLFIVIAVITVVARLYLTNRSLLGSLALGAMGFAADLVALWAFAGVASFLGIGAIMELRPPALPTVGWMLLCIATAFWIFALFTRRFMPLVSRR